MDKIMDKIKVLIADDHAIVRMGLVALIDSEDGLEVVGEADGGAAAVRKALKLQPDVVVMDLMMPDMSGIEATQTLREKLPEAKVLVLTTSAVADVLARVIEAGAKGVVFKSAANTRLLAAIRAVASGKSAVAPEVAEQLARDPPVQKLTDRQAEILASVTRGFTNADIARQLGISPNSVKDHVNAIFTKIGASTRAEAVAIALRKNLLKI